jgi:uncharacterized protein YllA (UPF0747 family)
LRPIYQESILPNLSYTGGPAETIYWLQLKAAFEAAEVPFPILVPRQFVMFLPESFAQKWFKAGFEEADIFKSSDELKKKYLQSAENEQTDFAPEYAETEILWEKIAEKAAFADKSLREWVLAEKSKSMKSLENIEKKVRKSLESKHETAVKQIFNLKERIYPNGSAQERTDNFLTFYVNDPNFLDKIFQQIDPLNFTYLTIWDEK